jgi:hypothetical protein
MIIVIISNKLNFSPEVDVKFQVNPKFMRTSVILIPASASSSSEQIKTQIKVTDKDQEEWDVFGYFKELQKVKNYGPKWHVINITAIEGNHYIESAEVVLEQMPYYDPTTAINDNFHGGLEMEPTATTNDDRRQ